MGPNSSVSNRLGCAGRASTNRTQTAMSLFGIVVRMPPWVDTAVLFSMPIEEDRKALARGLRRRDPELLDGLIERYQYRLFRYLVYISGNRENAEDLFQETWVRVLNRGHQYDGKSKFETWLFAIARHLVIDLHRRKRPQSLEALMEAEENPIQVPAGGASALDLATAREEQAGLLESLNRLSTILREVLLLRFQEDLKLEEIAVVIAAPVGTVKSRLYRGLEQLRELLKERSHDR
jgi:RNA polymerase sigma-70 factor, ECF subfamily